MNISAGIDVGMETTKAVVFQAGGIISWAASPGGSEFAEPVARRTLSEAVAKAGLAMNDLGRIVATGVGRDYVTFADRREPDFISLAKGINYVFPSAKTVLDLSARKSMAMRCTGGRTIKVTAGSKCAAGAGTFLQVVASVLRVDVYHLDELYAASKEHLEIQSTCAVFAESEIISLVHSGAQPEDIVKGIFRGLAGRIYSQLLELGMERDVALAGGVANSKAMVAALEEKVGFELLVAENPESVGALGAALIGQAEGSTVA